MDFLNRSAASQPQGMRANGGTAVSPTPAPGGGHDKNKPNVRNLMEPRWLRLATVVLLFSLTILGVALAMLLYFGGKATEGGYIDAKRYQAVFLTNGQVYFGQVKEITDKYVDLQDIYYLNTQAQPDSNNNSESQNQTFALVKLGCELHGPADQMLINREQITFWENLGSEGKVAKAIAEWQKQNPNGQKCEEGTTNSTQQSTTNNPTDTGNAAPANNNKRQ